MSAVNRALKVILHCPEGMPESIEPLVHQLVSEGVRYIAAVGPQAEAIENLVDDIALSRGSPNEHFVLTVSHVEEGLEAAVELAGLLSGEYGKDVEVMSLHGGDLDK